MKVSRQGNHSSACVIAIDQFPCRNLHKTSSGSTFSGSVILSKDYGKKVSERKTFAKRNPIVSDSVKN